MLFGVGFGLLIERAQICFTSAFRDMWITGRTHMAKAIIIGMAVSAIGIFSYVQLGVEPKIMWAGPNAVIGGLLFGFWHRAGRRLRNRLDVPRGRRPVHYWWVGLGNVIGSTILAYYWDDFAPALCHRLGQNQPAENLWPDGRPAGDIFAVVCSSNVDYRLGKTLLPPCGTADC